MIIKAVTPEYKITHLTLQGQMKQPIIQATQDTIKTILQEVQI